MEPHLISALHRVDGTILHLGAGECRELDAYLKTAAEQIVLVEPVPEAAEALRQRSKGEPRIKVIEAAVASQEEDAKLHRYSITGLATLHPQKNPPAQWPALREIAQLHVKALNLAHLLAQITLTEGKQHWLVIETPGEEKQVLRALGEHEVPQCFAHLSLTLGSLTPLVEQIRPVLLQTLDEIGYRLEHVVAQAGHLVYHAKADSQWKIIQRLQNEIQDLEKLQASNATLQQENRHLKVENENFQQRQAQLEEEFRKAEVQIELIKEMFLSKEEAQQLENQEREA